MLLAEFDAPGHANSWCTAYPQLCPSADCQLPMVPNGNMSYEIISALANEACGAFRSGMYHGGGDEVTYECWEQSPTIKAWMSHNKFSPQQAYAYFISRVANSLPSGTIPVFWQDAFQRAEPGTPLPPDTIIQFYKDGPFAKAAEEHRVVFANNHAWCVFLFSTTLALS